MLKKGFKRREEIEIRCKDGKIKWIQVDTKAHFTKDGKIKWIDGVVHNIEDRKKIEHELEQYKNHLEELVDKRTKQLKERLDLTDVQADSIKKIFKETDQKMRKLRESFSREERGAMREQMMSIRQEIDSRIRAVLFEDQVKEYELLRSGKYRVLKESSFEDLPIELIRARIALGLTQKQLAELVGLKEQQIQRYEETEYASASFSRLQEIIAALGLDVKEKIHLPKKRAHELSAKQL